MLLCQLAPGALPREGVTAAGAEYDDSARDLLKTWLDDRILKHVAHPEDQLDVAFTRTQQPEAPNATSDSMVIEASITDQSRFRLAGAMHFRLIVSGQLWVCTPGTRDYRLASGLAIMLLARLSSGHTLLEAAEEAGIACDSGVYAMIAKAIDMGLVVAA